MNTNNALLVIVGPTASGKTALSLELAARIGPSVEIISADSRQIYTGMDIGTAKPNPQELQQVPHHLINILPPNERYAAGRFADDAAAAIQEVWRRGNIPIVVGGSGFYVQALFQGLSAPTADPDVYAMLEQRLEAEGYDALHHQLQAVDPVAAAAHSPNNRAKTLRALACYIQTGQPYSDFLSAGSGDRGSASGRFLPRYVVISPARDLLYRRINQRVIQMLESGLMEEVDRLLAEGFTASDPGMRTVGYSEAIGHRAGEFGYERMVELIQQSTRRYAKRQMTWFRRLADGMWLEQGGEESVAKVRDLMELMRDSKEKKNGD
ncbi:MAG: tRNA (adenosine(37)-N6)-dimethylallyltransferase MiaA [Chlorobi bacterium]|nr:MAG: tRNA delta(2)-isopentenylpyrophosphate transferase [Chlorobi bacterium OLB7]MBK8910111.1 tRNA (adenosine(37)-N6)-dimethylallyltransferase MiaA [Chlorobiota bacterium]